MKKKGYYIVAAIAILFIGVNLYLLFKEDSKAERTVYVNEWSRVEGGDVIQTFETEGVALPDSEQYVYFDGQQGNMASFYVEEGDVITAGTPLFSYDTKELEEQKAAVEIETERLQDELKSIGLKISELKKIDNKAPSRNNNAQNSEVTVVVDISAIVKSNIEESIVVAEAEERKLEAELTAAKKKLAQLNERIGNATVYSEADGQVIRINEELTAPVITIASDNLVIEGILSEQQMKDVNVGQKVKLYSALHKQSYSAVISKINQYPKEAPSIGSEPIYSFMATLEEETAEDDLESEEIEEVSEDSSEQLDEKEIEEDNLFIGSNLEMNVIVEEAIAVPIISSDSAFSASGKKYVYKLTANGVIERQEIKVGLTFEGDSEVKSGLIFNDVIATNPKAIPRNNAHFILPMQTVGIQTEELRKMKKKQYAKYILMGLLEN